VAPQSRGRLHHRRVGLLSTTGEIGRNDRAGGSASTEATMRLSSRSHSCRRRLSQGSTTLAAIEESGGAAGGGPPGRAGFRSSSTR